MERERGGAVDRDAVSTYHLLIPEEGGTAAEQGRAHDVRGRSRVKVQLTT